MTKTKEIGPKNILFILPWPLNYSNQVVKAPGHVILTTFLHFCPQNSLVRLLTGKERDKARSVFLGLGVDKDGVITRAECRQAQQSWFHKLNKDSQSCNVR